MTVLIVFILLFIAATRPAHAYIDPGTGSYMLQIIIGSLLGAVFVIKSTWRSLSITIKRLLNRSHHDQHS